jgi:OmcA/MtrC family decaheme c-type cytochrome
MITALIRSRLAIVLVALAFTLLLISAPGPKFTPNDKAFYADEKTVNFVRPGLVVDIQSATIAQDGTIRTRVKVTDPRGLPLDRLGVQTPGNVSLSFIAAFIPRGQKQYIAYTTRTQVSTIRPGNSAIQATGENNGTFRVIADGEYEYEFRTKAPTNLDRSATHTIGVYSSRNLSEFDLGTQYDDDTFDFVPAGGAVTDIRDVIKTASCNRCHERLALHGGSRSSMELCVMCHTPQTVDPDTGNTQDMPVLIHKIHAGSSLPSVQAGTPYVVIGNANSVHDYSKIVMPSDVRRCQVCHEQDTNAAQKEAVFQPSRAACGACHDNVNFATGQGHATGLPQLSDTQCGGCHRPQGEIDFDASILGAHTIPTESSMLPGLVFTLVGVQNGTAGSRPVVTYQLADKNGNPWPLSEIPRLALVLAGPTGDYSTYVSEDPRATSTGANGNYTYTFNYTIPANARGTYTVGIEGYRNVTLLPGTTQQMAVRDAGINKTLSFSVDGSRVQNRAAVVSDAKCNSCHEFLSLHGGNRNRIDQCVLCHNPNQTDTARRPAGNGAPEAIDMKFMVHKIHRGAELENDYTVYGNGNIAHNYNEIHMPMDLRNCTACHLNNTQNLPTRAGLLDVTTPRSAVTKMGPHTAACNSCHDGRAAASHAKANTTDLGESCTACHGVNSDFSPTRVHAR